MQNYKIIKYFIIFIYFPLSLLFTSVDLIKKRKLLFALDITMLTNSDYTQAMRDLIYTTPRQNICLTSEHLVTFVARRVDWIEKKSR